MATQPQDVTAHGAAVNQVRMRSQGVLTWLEKYGALSVLAALLITFSVLYTDTFATWSNAVNILDQASLAAIIAMGLSVVLLSGEFDLSIGYLASFAGILTAGFQVNSGMTVGESCVLALAVCVLSGLANALLVTWLRINALVATLGLGTVIVGLNYAYSGGSQIVLAHPDHFISLAAGRIFGIPHTVYITAALAIVLWVFLNRTKLGLSLQAVGGNEEAARLAGVRVGGVRMIAFVIAAVCAGMTGILLASRIGGGSVQGGDAYLLNAYAASFFGTAVLRPGQFHIVGTLVGVITVTVGFNAIALIGASTFWQYLFQGGLLLVAVSMGSITKVRAR